MCAFRWLNEQKTWITSVFGWQIVKTYSEKSIFFLSSIQKNRFSDPEKPEKSISVLKVFEKIDFHYSGEVTHPTLLELWMSATAAAQAKHQTNNPKCSELGRAAERGGPGGLLTPGPVVKHGARAAWLVSFLFCVWLMFCFDHCAGAIKLYTCMYVRTFARSVRNRMYNS